jgi:3-oxoisoapionate decarboxylase
MKLGIDSFSYHLHFGKHWFKPSMYFDLYMFCKKCLELKADGIHLDPMHIDIKNDTDWLNKFCENNGLFIEIGAIGISSEEILPSIIAAKKLNSKILRIFIGGNCEDGKDASKKRALQAKETLKKSLELAGKHNIILALENHGDLFFDDYLDVLSINSPFLGACFDSGNFSTIGINPKDALGLLIDKVVCTHIKDVYPPDFYPDAEPFGIEGYKFHFGALGGGVLPLKEITDLLKNAKRNDFNLSLEIHTPYRKTLNEKDLLELERRNLENSVEYAREILGIKGK